MEGLLLDALRTASAHPEGALLYRSAKHDGLFPPRDVQSETAANFALDQGLLEPTRYDERNLSLVRCARLTQRGQEYLTQYTNPKQILEELHATLKLNREGMPHWQEEFRAPLLALSRRLEELFEKHRHQLDELTQHVEETLRRIHAPTYPSAKEEGRLEPWHLDLLILLRDRSAVRLSQLYGELKRTHAELRLAVFHEGLLYLRDRGSLLLLPGSAQELDEPEHALLHKGIVYVSARR